MLDLDLRLQTGEEAGRGGAKVVAGREMKARVILIVGMLAVAVAVAAFASAGRASGAANVLPYDEPTAILLSGSLLLGLGGVLRRFLV